MYEVVPASCSAFAASGWLAYAQPWPWTQAAPAWIWSVWLAFALTFNHSMAFLGGRPWLSALIGLLGGPCVYRAAGAFNALHSPIPTLELMLVLGLAWATVLPLLFALNRRYSRPVGSLA